MRLLVLKACALALALGVLAYVVQASRTRALPPAEAEAPAPRASDADAAADAGPPAKRSYGIIGPATKADPHVMRRAAESLEEGTLAPQPAAPGSP